MATEVWSDLNDALVTDNQGNILKAINIEAVKVSIKNMLGTYKGERTFLPQFGSNLGDLVFEPINSGLLNRLATDLKENIEIWDDRVIVMGVDIKSDPDRSSVEIMVNFNVRGYTETFTTSSVVTA
jgi:phage baseplate assembly protein W